MTALLFFRFFRDSFELVNGMAEGGESSIVPPPATVTQEVQPVVPLGQLRDVVRGVLEEMFPGSSPTPTSGPATGTCGFVKGVLSVCGERRRPGSVESPVPLLPRACAWVARGMTRPVA